MAYNKLPKLTLIQMGKMNTACLDSEDFCPIKIIMIQYRKKSKDCQKSEKVKILLTEDKFQNIKIKTYKHNEKPCTILLNSGQDENGPQMSSAYRP